MLRRSHLACLTVNPGFEAQVAVAFLVAITLCTTACKSGTRDRISFDRDGGTVDAGDLADKDGGDEIDADTDGVDAAPLIDSGMGYQDAEPVDPCRPSCGPEELCGEMMMGDGLDDDCDGTVDETCPCSAPGITQSCFLGPPDRKNVGACTDGIQACNEFLEWSACTNGVFPVAETCDGSDNDCNGTVDDGIADCATTIMCPERQSAQPLNRFLLRGSDIYSGDAETWSWTIACPPTVADCPAPTDPAARNTEIFFTQSGTYQATLEIGTGEGDPLTCSFAIVVAGTGLRVELTWSSQGTLNGDTDVDLHLHRRTPQGVATGMDTPWFNGDDCYFGNCVASFHDVDWGIPPTLDLSACENAPRGVGDEWARIGNCANPRLDIDVVFCDSSDTNVDSFGYCAPENINVDNPVAGEPYRIMVHYYGDHGFMDPTDATVNVYCGGELRATLTNTLRNGGSTFAPNDHWIVGDVVFAEADMCGVPSCMLTPLDVIQGGQEFGPPWSF